MAEGSQQQGGSPTPEELHANEAPGARYSAEELDRLRLLGKHVQVERSQRNTGRGVAKVSDLNRATWANIEAGQPAYRSTYAKVERFMGWAPGSMWEFRQHGGPLPSRVPAEDQLRVREVQDLDAFEGLVESHFVTLGIDDPVEQLREMQKWGLRWIARDQRPPDQSDPAT